MNARSAEVVVRFADTIVQVLRIAPGARCVVGRTRDADIALDVAPVTLIESTAHGFVAAGAPLADAPIRTQVGPLAITVSLVESTAAALARRAIERRPFAYGAISIVAHAAILATAIVWGVVEDGPVPAAETSRRRPTKIARFAVAAQTIKRVPNKPAPATLPITTDTTPSPEPSLDEPVAPAVRSIASVQTPNGRGPEKVPATAASLASDAESPSDGRRFDPSESPAFDTVKVGNYTTVATGRTGGEHYELAGANGERKRLVVVSCDAASCLVIGGSSASPVRRALEARLADIVKCYEDHAASAGKKVEVDFGIDEAGKAHAVNVGGVGDYNSCVANIVASIEFASAD